MTLPEESIRHAEEDMKREFEEEDSKYQWDINDGTLPPVAEPEPYNEWPNGHSKHVYPEESEDARRHTSGWAMRNTNNHNVNILKKSCLGVLVCTLRCTFDNGNTVHLRPAICDKARRKQYGKPCPNGSCQGRLELLACRGHCGYPVTHFWRHTNGRVYFQAKGVHDHEKPEVKASAEARRHHYVNKEQRLMTRSSRKRTMATDQTTYVPAKIQHLDSMTSAPYTVAKDSAPILVSSGLCSCPPFECMCPAGAMAALTQPTPTYQTAMALESKTTLAELNDINFSPHWKDSYHEYFDLSFDQQKQMHMKGVQDPVSAAFNTSVFGTELSKACELSPGGLFSQQTIQGHLKQEVSMNCVYSSSGDMVVPGSGHSSPRYAVPTNPMLVSPDSAHPARDRVVPGSALASSTTHSHYHYEAAGQYLLDELEFNVPADILSLDQPINKDNAMAADSEHRPHAQRHDAESSKQFMSSLDFSALLGLPSITSFLGEEQTAADGSSSDRHATVINSPDASCYQVVPSQAQSDCALSSKTSCSPSPSEQDNHSYRSSSGSPPSLTELQPLPSTMTSKPERSAFLPYSDHAMPKEMFSPGSDLHLFSPTMKSAFPDPFDTFGQLMSPDFPFSASNQLLSPNTVRNVNHNINITLSYQ